MPKHKKKSGGGAGKNDGKKKFLNASGRFAKENKLTITFDPDDRKNYLTGFHKRKLERQRVAIEEMKTKERNERLKQRELYRDELKTIVDGQRPAAAAEKKKKAAELTEQDPTEEKFETTKNLVTVTTVEYGFGDEDDKKSEDESEDEQIERVRPRLNGNSIMAIKKLAYKGVLSRLPETKKPKIKSRKSGGAQPKRKGPKNQKQRPTKDKGQKKGGRSGATKKGE
eukprot:m.18560 g.18560  ORF g.18560 m.18560 type:complete len:226 (-) comp12082_c0_seq1:24-701(-)